MSLIQPLLTTSFVTSPMVTGDYSFWSLFMMSDWVIKAVMLILVLASVWSWVVAIDKFIMVRMLRRRATQFEDTFWSGRTLDELNAALGKDMRDPMARVFSAAMREYNESGTVKRVGSQSATHERIDSVMNLVINRELAKAEKGLPVLGTVASISVFIGLFGTVWGIMNSFRAIAASENTNLAVVAPGIAEALFATALGLIAAIPAKVFYDMYLTDIDKYGGRLEGYADELSAILGRKLSNGG
ncbi:protein TolQ [uncultured Algimonas sp.]|uniref:protein TolQ n=1 Tax=uncultured Algimonas sp. TaxID=1547920 RepID=UPI00260244BC|nr:protein TolQ [uncultured Algimonas sp.]